MVNPDFFIVPIFDYENEVFYRKVKYVDDVFAYTKDSFVFKNVIGNSGDLKMDTKSFGSYKNKRWEFQNETRFVICIYPFNMLLESFNPDISSKIIQSLLSNKPLSINYYDMNLKDEALETMEITLSPSASEAQKVLLQALVDRYNPKAKILESSLGKLVRL